MQPEQNLKQSRDPALRNMKVINPSNSTGTPPPAEPSGPSVPPPTSGPPPKKHFEGWPSILSTLALFLLAPLIAVFLAAFVVQSYEVDGQSMETTLQNADRLIVDKWPRTWSRITGHVYVPKRGNIIIFNQSGLDFSGASSKQLIKRVIGLPGEHVVVSGGNITIYNQEHPEGFDPDKAGIYSITAPVTPGNVDLTLKNNEIFVCGDNRTNSEDSRYFGPINTSQVVGKLSFRIIPLNNAQKF